MKKLISVMLLICLMVMPVATSEEEIVLSDDAEMETGTIELDIADEFSEPIPEDISALDLSEDLLIDLEESNDNIQPSENGSPNTGNIAIDETNFPDAIFRAYVADNCDGDGDGYLSDNEINRTVEIDVAEKGIKSLKGIEFFDELITLNCSENELNNYTSGALNLTDNTKLESLNCSENPLSALDLSKNTNLKSLECEGCGLRSLDVSHNKELEELNCQDNRDTLDEEGNETEEYEGFSTLDISKNKKLRILYCGWNVLTKLNVNNNRNLIELDCANNLLQSLDVSNNSHLAYLGLALNSIPSIDITNCSKLIPYVKRSNLMNEGDGYCDFLDDNRNCVLSIPSGSFVTVKGKVVFGAAAWQIVRGYEAEIGVGEEYNLVYDSFAEFASYYTFKSSKPKIASVSAEGKVTGKKVGKAKISISGGDNYYDGPEEAAVCKITVKKAPDRINLSETKMTLAKGEHRKISWEIPKGTACSKIQFFSSDKSVCKVVDVFFIGYMVEAYKPGTATITVKTYNGKKATCKVTVIDPAVPTKVKLNKTGTVKLKKGKTLQLKATVSPSTAETTLTWKSSKEKIATVTQDGLVTAKKKGTTTITVVTGNGKTAKVKIKVV